MATSSAVKITPIRRLFLTLYFTPLAVRSFPTRRSSDLAVPSASGGGASHDDLADAAVRGDVAAHVLDGHGDARDRRAKDRKSTRLNTSHASTSSAVMCLTRLSVAMFKGPPSARAFRKRR